MNHTPGPWQVAKVSRADVWQIWGADESTVACTVLNGGVLANPGKGAANAALIAAAPELLAVAQETVDALRRCLSADGSWTDCPAAHKRTLLDRAEDAVAKATTP